MQSFVVVFYCILFTDITCRGLTGLSEDQQAKLSDYFVKYGADCLAMHPVSVVDLQAFLSYKVPQGRDAACFFGCIFKNTNILDDTGKLSSEKVKELTKKVFDSDIEQSKILEVFQGCTYVNDLETTDGEEGCDRAKFILTCLMDETRKEVVLKSNDRLTSPSEVDSKTDMTLGIGQIVQGVIRSIIKLVCLGVSKEFIPGQILHKILPGLDNISTFCSFV